MESFFFNMGFSYTMSKATPYLLFILLGLIIAFIIWKKSTNKWIKLAAILVFAAPFSIYFALHPIYQGDFTNEARILQHTDETSELSGKKLVVVAMPGCRYCEHSIYVLKAFKKDHPSVQIEYIVTSEDSTTLDFYAQAIQGEFPLGLAKNPYAMANTIAQGRFPTFVLLNGNEPMQVWNNNNFGVVAYDEIVKKLK